MVTFGSARLRLKSSESKSTFENRRWFFRPLTSSLSAWREASASPGTHSSAIKPGRASAALVGAAIEGRLNNGPKRGGSVAAPNKLVLAGRLVEIKAGGWLK